MKARVVILASGGGTTAEAFIRASAQGAVDITVAHIIVSRKNAGIFKRISDLNAELNLAMTCELVNHQTHPAAEGETIARGCQTAAEQAAIIDVIRNCQADLVVLMGYMKRVGPQVVQAFGWHAGYTSPYQARLLNTHPGLFPETKGLYGLLCQEKVLELGLPEAGQTLHVVSEEYDDGPTIAEHRVPVESTDTAESLFARVRLAEKQYLPGDVEQFITRRQAWQQS